MEELVSVIVPVYNVEKYLKECIESICAQTYRKLEIILVNDGSRDSSFDICQELALQDRRIRVIDKENGGLSSARNAGMAIAGGKYYSFIDSDDYIEAEMIQDLISIMKVGGADICCCNYDFCDENSKIFRKNKIAVEGTQFYQAEEAIELLLLENYFKCFAWNKLFKRELFDGITYPEGKIYEDIYTTYSLIKKCAKVALTGKTLYHYRMRNDSITRSVFNKRKYDVLEPIRRIHDENIENKNVLIGCTLYYLYFIDDMILGKYWDSDVYQEFQDCIKQVRVQLKSNVQCCSKVRKLQLFLCAKNLFIYKVIYKTARKLHK